MTSYTITPIATVHTIEQAYEALAAAGYTEGVIAYVNDADFDVYAPTASRAEAEACTAAIWAECVGLDASEIEVGSCYITVRA